VSEGIVAVPEGAFGGQGEAAAVVLGVDEEDAWRPDDQVVGERSGIAGDGLSPSSVITA
jgi:hypothetical protein